MEILSKADSAQALGSLPHKKHMGTILLDSIGSYFVSVISLNIWLKCYFILLHSNIINI